MEQPFSETTSIVDGLLGLHNRANHKRQVVDARLLKYENWNQSNIHVGPHSLLGTDGTKKC